ncbi:hypothetical protein HMH01_09985 [Halovulum dunhuangense]|uniref:Uncharacterized protein n=1 Tax=Halovulum dunhuangense TaxID=1505036 RepID=A0A849L351_9RHOB|nr:hypothetical protein [Halovulum dunhuangense]NNU80766.1 hypothetical protein [Halovulum dunhuangense]
MGRGTSLTEQFLAIGFVLIACLAVFGVLHKDEIMAGEIDQVVASYISGGDSEQAQ